jgi:hypothetical protein
LHSTLIDRHEIHCLQSDDPLLFLRLVQAYTKRENGFLESFLQSCIGGNFLSGRSGPDNLGGVSGSSKSIGSASSVGRGQRRVHVKDNRVVTRDDRLASSGGATSRAVSRAHAASNTEILLSRLDKVNIVRVTTADTARRTAIIMVIVLTTFIRRG